MGRGIFTGLALHPPTSYQITACAPLLAYPDKYQIIVEFEQVQMKVKFLGNFSQFAHHELETRRRLQISNTLETNRLFKGLTRI